MRILTGDIDPLSLVCAAVKASFSFKPCAAWALCLVMLCLVGTESAWARDTWQYRAEGQITANMATNFKATITTQSRYDDSGSFYYQHSDLALAYTGLAPWMDVSLNYKVIFTQQTNDNWTYGTLPHLNATVRFPFFGVKLSNRLRLEYASLQDLSDYGTVRNKLSINPPFYLDPIRETARKRHQKVRPYGSVELFYNTDSGQVVRYEFTGGVTMSFSDRVFCDLYYIRQENAVDADYADVFDGLNIAGFKLRLLF